MTIPAINQSAFCYDFAHIALICNPACDLLRARDIVVILLTIGKRRTLDFADCHVFSICYVFSISIVSRSDRWPRFFDRFRFLRRPLCGVVVFIV